MWRFGLFVKCTYFIASHIDFDQLSVIGKRGGHAPGAPPTLDQPLMYHILQTETILEIK